MVAKTKVYGRTRRKKDDGLCAAFQSLELSTPGVWEEIGNEEAERGAEGKAEKEFVKVDGRITLSRASEDIECLDSAKVEVQSSSKSGAEDSLPAKETMDQIIKENPKHTISKTTDRNSLIAGSGSSTRVLVKIENVGKASRPKDVSPQATQASQAPQTGSRWLRATNAQEAITRCHSSPISDLEILRYLSPLTNIAGVNSAIKAMDQWYEEWTTLCNMTKIAEGSYGSVFRLSDKGGLQEATIGKLMPLKSKSGKGSRKAGSTHVVDAASEVLLLERISHVPGFVEFRSAEVLIGSVPNGLKKEYKMYEKRRKEKGDCEETPCEISYPDTQCWVFIEMSDAGTELEDALCLKTLENRLVHMNAQGEATLAIQLVRDIFWEVADVLACGEEAQEFEHRDLHFSNICIKEKHGTSEGYSLIPKRSKIEVTLIDYTLSRTTLADGTIVSNRMTDQEIFNAKGDLQFEVYRWMRNAMPGKDAKHKDWGAYVPFTNVLWLYHLLAKLLQQTSRPPEHHEEELWKSLHLLKQDIDPTDGSKKIIFSARDVLKYARQGRDTYLKQIGQSRKINQEKGNVPQVVRATRRMRIR